MQIPQNKISKPIFTLDNKVIFAGEIWDIEDWEFVQRTEEKPWRASLYKLQYPFSSNGGFPNKSKAKAVPITNFLEFKNNVAKCIWHEDKNPSLHYYPNTNSVFCFSCGKYGDVIDVVRQLHDCSFQEAAKILTA